MLTKAVDLKRVRLTMAEKGEKGLGRDSLGRRGVGGHDAFIDDERQKGHRKIDKDEGGQLSWVPGIAEWNSPFVAGRKR